MIKNTFDIILRKNDSEIIDTGLIAILDDMQVNTLNIRVMDGLTDIDYAQVDYGTIIFANPCGNVTQGSLVKAADRFTYTIEADGIPHTGSVDASIQLFGLSGEKLAAARFRFDALKDVTASSADNGSQAAYAAKERKRDDLSAILTKDGAKVVFTGDSISFNKYEFSPDWIGENDAYSYYPGMLSWSFMFRDAIHADDPYFRSCEEIDFKTSGAAIKAYNNLPQYCTAFNNRGVTIQSNSPSDYVEFRFKTNPDNGKIVLYYFSYNDNTACSFDVYVNGVMQARGNNYTADTVTWRGFQPLYTEITTGFTAGEEVTVKITNMAAHSGTAAKLFLNAVGTIKRNVYMTGHGGWMVSELLEDIRSRILQYSPDVLLLAIGSNDAYYQTPVDIYKANLESVINQARAIKPKCEIVLFTSSYMTEDKAGAIDAEDYKFYNSALRDLSAEYNCHLIDMVDFFKDFDISLWRYDNVHLNKMGNTMFARYVINRLMPLGDYNPKYINASLYYTDSGC